MIRVQLVFYAFYYCLVLTGMSSVDYAKRAIDLKQHVDISKYTIYDGVHVRMSSKYRINSNTNVTMIENPGNNIMKLSSS
jgi:hypothetical protein